LLGWRQISEVRPVAFARMEDGQAGGPPRRQEPLVRAHGAAQLRDVVAKHFAKAARLEKIALHVDDQERAMRGRECELVRFGGKVDGRGHLLGPLRGPHRAVAPHARTGPKRWRTRSPSWDLCRVGSGRAQRSTNERARRRRPGSMRPIVAALVERWTRSYDRVYKVRFNQLSVR